MKNAVLTVVAGLALAGAAVCSTLADEVSDPLSGLTVIGETQLEAARGGKPVPTQQEISGAESSSFGAEGPATSSPGGLGGVGANQTGNLSGGMANLGTGTLSPVTGPINMGLGYVGSDIGTQLPTLP